MLETQSNILSPLTKSPIEVDTEGYTMWRVKFVPFQCSECERLVEIVKLSPCNNTSTKMSDGMDAFTQILIFIAYQHPPFATQHLSTTWTAWSWNTLRILTWSIPCVQCVCTSSYDLISHIVSLAHTCLVHRIRLTRIEHFDSWKMSK